ncbi:MAG TPA: ribulose bisphosphate carboxylase small subunit [Acidimicrobiia bacterium]|nr:ribulose bisphosphate carboxylase small subunit [Acidimicrobiia bacterium]
MRLTQGAFSYLGDLTDNEIELQVTYCLENGWAVAIEHTDDPHPRNTYWEMWGQPKFDLESPDQLMEDLGECRERFGDRYIRVSGFDNAHGWESVRLSFIVNRPREEPGFELSRTLGTGRTMRYRTRSYATDQPSGRRYPPADS